jgi:hypothetical protein
MIFSARFGVASIIPPGALKPISEKDMTPYLPQGNWTIMKR